MALKTQPFPPTDNEVVKFLVEQWNLLADATVAAAGNGNTLAAAINAAGAQEIKKISFSPDVGVAPRFPLA